MTKLLEVSNLKKTFTIGRKDQLMAVDDISFSVSAGEVLGIVGESGCGKSTLVRLIARLLEPQSGEIRYNNQDLLRTSAAEFHQSPLRREVQMVFQDPSDSLNPLQTAFASIADPVRRLTTKGESHDIKALVERATIRVGLPLELLSRRPHQLSGGQKARVGIARAIVLEPRLVILDEPTAALDVSVQSVVLKTLAKLRHELGLAYIFVSHDLKVIQLLSDRVLVIYLGKVVETGTVQEVFKTPQHPYTRALINSIPRILANRAERVNVPLDGEPGSPINPDPNRCRFALRCPKVQPLCVTQAPSLAGPGTHAYACHFPAKL